MYKLRFAGLGALLLGVISVSTLACGEKKVDFKNDMERVSYTIGYQIGMNFQHGKLDEFGLDVDILSRAINDVFKGRELSLTEEQMDEVMHNFQADYQARMESELAGQVQRNAARASAFLAENAQKPGVVTLEDSLQYEVLVEGNGPKPKETDVVSVHYVGTNLDGVEFDSSYRRGEPAEMPISGVIEGWGRILQLMNVGSKWIVYIPPALAYGEREVSPEIPANSLLIFEIELLSILD